MKWVTNWANAISIRTNKPEMYSKNITLRYPILANFSGNKIRITLDNFTGNEKAHFAKITIAKAIEKTEIDLSTLKTITFQGNNYVDIEPKDKSISDEIEFEVEKNDILAISIYLDSFISMRPATITTGPLSKAFFSTGDQSEASSLASEITKSTQWNYYLSDVEIYTNDDSKNILCFGDSITAQSWPEYLQLKCLNENVAIIRKAASGARVLREYTCLEYESYGLKSDVRFAHDIEVNGCVAIIILEGINDIIHPVGIETNIFRPMSDLPTSDEIIKGYRKLIKMAKNKGLKVFIGTLNPIKGWRTYAFFREEIRLEVNGWIRNTDEIDGYIDFDAATRDYFDEHAFNDEYDSGDHLHPSDKGYRSMADKAFKYLKKYEII